MFLNFYLLLTISTINLTVISHNKVFLDILKAFNEALHEVLLYKLLTHGIKEVSEIEHLMEIHISIHVLETVHANSTAFKSH